METITKIEDVHCPLRILTLHLNKKKLPHNILDPFCEVSLVFNMPFGVMHSTRGIPTIPG